jgi:queuine/archaeosine tRNA-ribosyltransferase
MRVYIGNDHVAAMRYIPNTCFSIKVLMNRKKPMPSPRGGFMLDSGGFQFIRQLGRYPLTPEEYLEKVAFLQPDIFVIQDWMCEPSQVERTGLSVREHIRRTVENYLYISELKENASDDIKGYCLPVLQGWESEDYFSCIDLYEDYGLIAPYMAVGSVCRRGKTEEIREILENIHAAIPKVLLHGLGVKKQVLMGCNGLLHSCDTAAGQYLKKDAEGRWITTKHGYYQMLQRYYFELSDRGRGQ